MAGDESATVNPPENVHFKLETNADSSWLGGEDGRSLRLEFGWEADEVDGDEELTIVNQPSSGHRVRRDDQL